MGRQTYQAMNVYKVFVALLFLQLALSLENPGIQISLGARGLDLGKFCQK